MKKMDSPVKKQRKGRTLQLLDTCVYVPAQLLDDDKSKFSNRHLVEKLDWYILPVANPDGYEWSRTEDRLWRKNR